MPRSINDLPGPRRLPLLGNIHQLLPTSRLHQTAEGWIERYGPIYRVDLGRRCMVVVSDLDEIARILRERPEGFRRGRELQEVFAEIGIAGVFSEEGETWRRQRRLTITTLNSNHLQRYFHIVTTATERLYRRLANTARDGRSVDITGELTSLTVDVTSALAFGHDLNTLERGEGELQSHIQRTFAMISRRLFAPVPYWRWVKLPADRALDRSLGQMRAAVGGFIEQARERMATRPELREAPENFLEGMLAAQESDGTFTDEEIIGNVFTLLLAGEDTTAHTMAWTLWLLTGNPQMQELWAQEAREVLGEQRFPDDYDTIAELSYGEAALRESMRLKPVAVALALESIEDCVIADTFIPAGTRLWLPTRYAGLQALERGDRFDPERWLNGGGERTGERPGERPDQKSFLAFGAGPRFCPGRNLAFLESKTAMAMIARNFEVELDESAGPVSELLAFTMIPRGLRVRLRERTAGNA
jgi:cytochrome P450